VERNAKLFAVLFSLRCFGVHLQGKTGKAVQDLYTPEIAATKSGYNTLDPMSIMNYDALHTNVRCGACALLVVCTPACGDMKPSITLGTAAMGRLGHLSAGTKSQLHDPATR